MTGLDTPLAETPSPIGEADTISSQHLRLDDMPEEIPLEITEYLRHAPHHKALRHPQPLTEKEAEHFNGLLDIQHRRDIMHLSTCCKWMRQTLFGLSLPNQLRSQSTSVTLHITRPSDIHSH
jgi:hypothetical protein